MAAITKQRVNWNIVLVKQYTFTESPPVLRNEA